MAKLSHKITTNNNYNSKNNSNNKKLGFSLSTKVEKNESDETKADTQETTNEIFSELIKMPITLETLLNKIGIKNFGSLTKTDLDTIFPPEVETPQDEATKKILSKLFSNELIAELEKYSKEINLKYSELFEKYTELNQKTNKQEIQIKNLTMQIDDAEEQIFKTEKKFADVVPVSDMIEEFIRDKFKNDYTQRISNLLIDSYKNSGKTGAKFIFNFAKGFVWIDEAMLKLGADDKENLDLLHEAGSNLLAAISEISVPERRPILDIIANYFNTHLHTYDFVSPEQTLQIDPMTHNAEGLGGSVVKEGISFAVVRRETRKTVYYADIKTK